MSLQKEQNLVNKTTQMKKKKMAKWEENHQSHQWEAEGVEGQALLTQC